MAAATAVAAVDVAIAGAIEACMNVIDAFQRLQNRQADVQNFRLDIESVQVLLQNDRGNYTTLNVVNEIRNKLMALKDKLDEYATRRSVAFLVTGNRLHSDLDARVQIIRALAGYYSVQILQELRVSVENLLARQPNTQDLIDRLEDLDRRWNARSNAIDRASQIVQEVVAHERPRIVIPHPAPDPAPEPAPLFLPPEIGGVRQEYDLALTFQLAWPDADQEQRRNFKESLDVLVPPVARRDSVPVCWTMRRLVICGGLGFICIVVLGIGLGVHFAGEEKKSATNPSTNPTTPPRNAASRIPSRAPTSNPNTAPIVITASPSTAATPLESSSTLAAVLERGYLSVGITNQEGFGIFEEGHWDGFEVDVGRAVSAATFGKDAFSEGRDSEPVKFFPVEATDRFKLLADGTIDVLLGTTSDTVERSINEVSSS